MYPQDTIQASSNLAVEGVIISVEDNYRIDGFMAGSYHIFHAYIRLKITGVEWVDDDLTDWITVDYENNTVNGWSTIGIGYDNPDKPQLTVGQTVECKGYYVPHTDTPYSYIITVSPSISESYLKIQTDVVTNGLVSTADQALEIAMPIVEQYAKENNRTITTVEATLRQSSHWFIEVGFEAVEGKGYHDRSGAYQVSMWADSGEIWHHGPIWHNAWRNVSASDEFIKLTVNEAIASALPIAEQYAQENNRTITTMVGASLSNYADSRPSWLIDVKFETIKSIGAEPWRDAQYWIDG